MTTSGVTWTSDDFTVHGVQTNLQQAASAVYDRTCRTSFDSPGFCVVPLNSDVDSRRLRRLMVNLKLAMTVIHQHRIGRSLAYLSAARFDQQQSTRPHLDGGPEECFLMLGYEPSAVTSELEISDYARCAFDMNLTPPEFMNQHNPMFQTGYDLLRPYTTRVKCDTSANGQIVCINNSSAPLRAAPLRSSADPWLGTLHTATILTPDESQRRVINSTMIASVPTETRDSVSEEHLHTFLTTSAVRRRGHDKPDLDDDV